MRTIRGWKTGILLLSSIATAALLLVVILRPSSSPRIAEASFHVARIDEFMVGTNANANVVYVEINMLAAGQHLVSGTRLTFWDNAGNVDQVVFDVPADVLSGMDRRWIMASSSFAAASGITPDFVFDVDGAIQAAGGMICWGAPGATAEDPPTWDATDPNNYTDCIIYGGAYAGPTPTVFGETVTSLTGGNGIMSVTRTNDMQPGTVGLFCPTPKNNANSVGSFGVCPPPAVGGIAVESEASDPATLPAGDEGSSSRDYAPYAAAGGAVLLLTMVAGAAWHLQRRRT